MATKLPMNVTPVGTAAWPWLNTPDTGYEEDGVYQVKMIFNKKDVKEIQAIVDPLMAGGKHNPVKPELDDQDKPTGNFIINFKLKAKGKTKSGGSYPQKPIIRDSANNRVLNKVGAGSKLRIAYNAVPFNQGAGGVTMRLKEVKIIELVEYVKKDEVDWGKDEGSFVGTTAEDSNENEEDNEDF